jgi:CheY-like chemotaxis protein
MWCDMIFIKKIETKKILWIEDSAYLLRGLVRPLEKKGYRVTYALNEKEAIDYLKKDEFQLILFDIIIPAGSDQDYIEFVGVRLAKTIINDMKIKTPIVGISVVNDPEIINELYGLGFKKIFKKGYLLPSELLKYVEDILML